MNLKKPKAGFYIGVTCPGCGGELELQENFFSLECSYCGSVLRILMPDTPPVYLISAQKQRREVRFQVDRYLKTNILPLTRSDFSIRRIYYPYWKIDAIRLKVYEEKIQQPDRQKVSYGDLMFPGVGAVAIRSALAANTSLTEERKIKVSLSPYTATQAAGPAVTGLPASLGLRTEYIKAIPFSAESCDEEYEYLPVTIPWDTVCSNLTRSVALKAGLNAGPGRRAKSELFHPVGSLIYFPYIFAQSDTGGDANFFIVDGISGRVVYAGSPPESENIPETISDSLACFSQLKVDFHRCCNCGLDLPATRSSVYICHNCHTVTSLDKNRVLSDGMSAAVPERRCADNQFPFWSFRISPEEIGKITSMHVGSEPPDQLLVPGFRISNFEAMRRLCQRMTRGCARMSMQPIDKHDHRFLPVEISMTEALTLAEILLYREMLVKNPDLTADSTKIRPEQVGLVYVPFHPEYYFYVDSVIGSVTFEKSLID
jgi:predicted RNA-binding Zn-ribbon protein involved in translation (DUF1610 family)